MAHSIEVVGNRTEIFNDLDLIAIISFISDDVRQNSHGDQRLRALSGRWDQDLSLYAPGAISLDLESELISTGVASAFVEVLDRIGERIRAFDNSVPASALNAINKAAGVTFFDYSKSVLLDALARLRGLLS